MAHATYLGFLAAPGSFVDATGRRVEITPARIDGWHRKTNGLIGEGFRIPTPWGHKLEAVPEGSDDPFAYDEAATRWNAGYVLDRKSVV